MVENTSNLTDAEAEQYDRQIRLWGLESQKRLRNSRVLVIGVKGFGSEIVKNITLAGIKSITLLDHGVVTDEDACAQFLAPRTSVGQNRAEASLARTQNLNPNVAVIVDTKKIEDHQDDFFAEFDVICATDCCLDQLLRLNRICREKGIKFFCGHVFGFFGFTFADLQIHEYSEDIIQNTVSTDCEADFEPEKKKIKKEPTKVTVKKSAIFVPFQDALDADWTSEPYKKRIKKADPSYFLLKVLLKFESKYKRNPSPASRETDIIELMKIRDEELENMSVPNDKIPDNLLSMVFGEVSPVCAIVGGVLSQEIIKALSQREAPHNNMFFFNPNENVGLVECIGN